MPSGVDSHFLVQIISTEDVIRNKNLESQLTKVGLEFQISPGVVPNEIDFYAGVLHSKFISKLICQRNLSIGEVGCALAHRNALSNLLDSDHKFGIIFEDDTEIIADFNLDVIVELLDSNLPIIIALGWTPGFAIAKNAKDLSSEGPIELITPQTGTFAYAINRQAAKLMINSLKKIIDFADWPIYTISRVRFHAVHSRFPWVTTNYDLESSTIGVRTLQSPTGSIRLLLSRIRLVSSLISLMLLSVTNILRASPKQIVHQLLIRGLIHRYGVSQVLENSTTNEVLPLPLKFQKILSLLKLA